MPADDRHRQARQVRMQPAGDKSSTRKVLVFADPERIKEIASRLRPPSSYEIVLASNPIGATTLTVRSNASVVIIDVSVAGLPGSKLLQILRKHPRLSNTGIVLLCQGVDVQQVRASYASSQRDEVLSTTMLDALKPTIERSMAGLARAGSAPLDTDEAAKRPAP
jgi:DNA-binding NtrC family response regulator